jgi:hypothetical protein
MDSMFHQLKQEPHFRDRRIQRRRCIHNDHHPQQQQQQQQQQMTPISRCIKRPMTVEQQTEKQPQHVTLLPKLDPTIATFARSNNYGTTNNIVQNEPTMEHQQFIAVNPNKPIKPFTFVDLGSGDGRVVVYASYQTIHDIHTENEPIPLFDVCVGYEINPILHLYAKFRSLITNLLGYSSRVGTTEFYLKNLWNVPLHNVDVVAVVRSLLKLILLELVCISVST